jgi:DNA polymerase
VSAQKTLQEVADQVAECTLCELHYSRKVAVAGEGPADAEIMFIGEGPGFHENNQGRPFVGAAGKYLDELLQGIGLKRDAVFITNIVKCRPPGNRDPRPEEIDACSAYLERQIQTINPKVIVTLGRFSMARYIPHSKISDVHGKAMQVRGRLVVPMYHPAAALHQRSLRPVIERDFSRLPEMIASAAEAPEVKETPAGRPPEPKQLSLF